jgi:hypothetical protein
VIDIFEHAGVIDGDFGDVAGVILQEPAEAGAVVVAQDFVAKCDVEQDGMTAAALTNGRGNRFS